MIDSNEIVLPVGIVCGYVKRIFDSEEMLDNITVLGEVSNLRYLGGYAYFNLKDSDGLLQCACFGLPKNEIPKDGDKIFAKGSVSFYQKGGKLSFVVKKISYTGKGELLLQYQLLKEKLQKEGLFDDEHKKQIPRFPKSVCVVTSKSGAVIKDIVRTIRNKNTKIDISVVDARVQGEGAVRDIVKGLALADKTGADVIILARGGGSVEDLSPFNDESVARAVYSVKTPIISAVGHESDLTLTDFVADVRASTPTGAGEIVSYNENEVKDYVLKTVLRIYSESLEIFDSKYEKIKYLINNFSVKSGYFYEKNKNRYLDVLNRIVFAVKDNFEKKYQKTELLLQKINTSNPIKVLQKGLYKVYFEDKPLDDVKKIKVGSQIKFESLENVVEAEVVSVKSKCKTEGER